MALREAAAEYFRNINSMANRLYDDMTEIRGNYEELWDSFSETEKAEIISEGIIKPEVSVRYSKDMVKTEYQSVRKVDNNYTFRDEHSGPFRFKTSSQENLSLMVVSKISPKGSSKVCFKQKKREEPISIKTGNEELNAIPKTGLDLLDNW